MIDFDQIARKEKILLMSFDDAVDTLYASGYFEAYSSLQTRSKLAAISNYISLNRANLA